MRLSAPPTQQDGDAPGVLGIDRASARRPALHAPVQPHERMNILVITLDVPATNNMPGSPRHFNVCRMLSQRHRITLLTPGRSQERLQALRDDPTAAGVFERILVLPEPPPAGWWGSQVHRLRQEVHFVTRYRNASYHAAQCRHVRDVFVDGAFDVFYVDTLPVAQYVMDTGPAGPAIIDLHDCLTLLLDRTMRVERSWLRKLALYLGTRSMARAERALRGVFTSIVTNSPVDEAYFQSVAPGANTLTIGNGVDTAFFRPGESDGDLHRLIFTGVMDYGPNEDAAIHFVEHILPLIQRRRPAVEFWIVGKAPTARVRRLGERPGVHVTGAVPDVRPHLEQAGIFVCPLRFGTGVKNKLLAALAMGKPVVATQRSLDGLDLRADEDVLVADAPDEFAAKVLALIEQPSLARRLAASGRAFVSSHHSWERSATAFEGVLRRAIALRPRVVAAPAGSGMGSLR